MNKINNIGKSINQLTNDKTSALNINTGKGKPDTISNDKLNSFIIRRERNIA